MDLSEGNGALEITVRWARKNLKKEIQEFLRGKKKKNTKIDKGMGRKCRTCRTGGATGRTTGK